MARHSAPPGEPGKPGPVAVAGSGAGGSFGSSGAGGGSGSSGAVGGSGAGGATGAAGAPGAGGALVAGGGEPGAERAPGTPPLEVPRTRAGATYAGVGVGLVVLVVVLIFVIQNLNDTTVHFVTVKFRLPVGLLVLASAVAGGIIVLLVSVARVAQLRLVARRHRRAHPPS